MKKLFAIICLALGFYVYSFAQSVPTLDKDSIYVVVEKMPQFPGGQQALFKYLSENLKWPAGEWHGIDRCRIVVRCIVEKDGALTNIEIYESCGIEDFEKESLRVLRAMPNWIPGEQEGKKVRVRYIVPINFKLAQEY